MQSYHRPFNDAICYYQVGDSKTYNKFEAIKWANGDISKIHFYFLDDVWDDLDMTVEPQESWGTLMKERCFQVRDSNELFGISYSGGYDSQTILDYCIINGVKVDELVVCTWNYLWDPSIDWQQPEGKSTPLLAQWYKTNIFPDIKISILTRDVDWILKTYESADDDIMFEKSNEIGFIKNNRALHVNNSYAGAVVLNNYKKTVVDGHEKPYLIIKDGWWYMSFPDVAMQFSLNSPYEAFYISKQLPKLHLKQTHMMINWLESLPSSTVDDVDTNLKKCYSTSELENSFYYRYNIAVGRTKVDHWNSYDCISNGKFKKWPNGLYDPNTICFFKAYKNVEGVKSAMLKWHYSAKYFIETHSQAFNGSQSKQIWSKEYPIKPVEPGRLRESNIMLTT